MATLKTVGYTENPYSGLYNNGKVLRTVNAQFNMAAANITANDVVRLTGALSCDSKLHRVMVPAGVAATAGFTDNDLILMVMKTQADGTQKLEKITGSTIIVDGLDFSSEVVCKDLLSENTSLDKTKTLKELAGSNFEGREVFICLEVKNKPTAAVKLDLDLVLENSTTN